MDHKNFVIYDIPEDEIYEWKIAALKARRRTGEWAREVLNREAEKWEGRELVVEDLKKVERGKGVEPTKRGIEVDLDEVAVPKEEVAVITNRADTAEEAAKKAAELKRLREAEKDLERRGAKK